jgi:hypothetical protein
MFYTVLYIAGKLSFHSFRWRLRHLSHSARLWYLRRESFWVYLDGTAGISMFLHKIPLFLFQLKIFFERILSLWVRFFMSKRAVLLVIGNTVLFVIMQKCSFLGCTPQFYDLKVSHKKPSVVSKIIECIAAFWTLTHPFAEASQISFWQRQRRFSNQFSITLAEMCKCNMEICRMWPCRTSLIIF